MSNTPDKLPDVMFAAVAPRYGAPDVVELRAVPVPQLRPGGLLVRVEASAVNAADARTRGLAVPQPMKTLMRLVLGVTRPRRAVLGTVFAGTVAAVSDGVAAFKPGDRVFGATPGMQFGCHAEYVSIGHTDAVAPMPEGADAGDMASLVFGGATALFFLDKAGAARGKQALVYGASGAVGSMAAQIAKAMGMQVTAVASRSNQDMLQSLGADACLAYDAPGFRLPDAAFDLVFDAVGRLPRAHARAALRQGGGYATVGGAAVCRETAAHMRQLAAWYASGALRPVIEQRFQLTDIVQAHRLADTGRKRGSAVVLMP